MPRFKAATGAHRYAEARTPGQKLWLASYGRATESVGGTLACEIARHENIARSVQYIISGRPNTKKKLQPILDRAKRYAAEAQKELNDKSTEARRKGNHCFFQDVADAVKVIAEKDGKPVEQYRHEILVLFLGAQKPTKRQIVDHLSVKFPELSERGDLPREVFRWCNELGLKPARASSVRTNHV